jgi:hypothetical protein
VAEAQRRFFPRRRHRRGVSKCIGELYEDGSGTKYLSLIGQPILIYLDNAAGAASRL